MTKSNRALIERSVIATASPTRFGRVVAQPDQRHRQLHMVLRIAHPVGSCPVVHPHRSGRVTLPSRRLLGPGGELADRLDDADQVAVLQEAGAQRCRSAPNLRAAARNAKRWACRRSKERALSAAHWFTPCYLPYEPQQMMLLPKSLQEWLPEGHLAHFISDTIDGLDLAAFHARYDKDGPRNQPFHPAMMVKVLVYGYATGVFSSRKIARKLHEDVAFRVLAARNFPAHRTIRDFRAFHLKELSDLFVQVVRLAREMGLVKLGTIAVDGTKVKANASRHKAMSYGHMLKAEAELKAQIEALLNKARAADEAEKYEPELDFPAEIAQRQDRLDAIAAARTRLEQRQRDADLERGRSDDDDQ